MKTSIARTIAFLLGGFIVLNIVGDWLHEGFDANGWWIDLNYLPAGVSGVILICSAVYFLAFAVRPKAGRARRVGSVLVFSLLATIALVNSFMVYQLHWRGVINVGVPIAVSVIMASVMVFLVYSVLSVRNVCVANYRVTVGVITAVVCIGGFCFSQIFCFGYTDYRRGADAIVVFGARAYADGRPSDALADRVRTACELYDQGLRIS